MGRSYYLLFSHAQCKQVHSTKRCNGHQTNPSGYRTHTRSTSTRARVGTHAYVHTHTHVLQFIGGMKKNATLEKNATVWVKTEFLANRLVIYKFISLRHYHCFLTFVQEARWMHTIKMFTFNGKTTHNGSLSWTHFQVFAHRFFWVLYQLSILVRQPPGAAHLFSFKQKKWNDQHLPLFSGKYTEALL